MINDYDRVVTILAVILVIVHRTKPIFELGESLIKVIHI